MKKEKRSEAPARQRAKHAVTWAALVASTTLGLDAAASTVVAEVRSARPLRDPNVKSNRDSGDLRLIVQTYDASASVQSGASAMVSSKPVASFQRAVTTDELHEGVQVHLVELRDSGASLPKQGSFVVAWVESGQPDLEFDARAAKPGPGSVYGVARVATEGIRVELNRHLGRALERLS